MRLRAEGAPIVTVRAREDTDGGATGQ